MGALSAYVTLIRGYGHRAAGEIMKAVHRGDPPAALAVIDLAHVQLQRDRETLASVAEAVGVLLPSPPPGAPPSAPPAAPPSAPPRAARVGAVPTPARRPEPVTVGALAHRLGVTPATLRKWEAAGILTPARDRSGRIYSPADVRDADLAHLLRRGGYLLGHIATVVRQVRTAGGPEPLAASLAAWRRRIDERARAMLTGAARLSDYLDSGFGAEPGG